MIAPGQPNGFRWLSEERRSAEADRRADAQRAARGRRVADFLHSDGSPVAPAVPHVLSLTARQSPGA